MLHEMAFIRIPTLWSSYHEDYTPNLIHLINIALSLQEQKRQQEQFAAEQEALFCSRLKKPLGQANPMVGTPTARRISTPASKHGVSSLKERREIGRVNNAIPLNFVALPKEDPLSRGN
ncbi:hypothetical protein HRI_001691400 [Hibiscus trionum]|uniref:Uncharacterized protein n=1 Tax=Hibiscus trionum TaxID=183268 RepID=A0A9W7HMV7_HIBTR|nr:hypothetical protein HRI_001691400 [Hibiscus trionum]